MDSLVTLYVVNRNSCTFGDMAYSSWDISELGTKLIKCLLTDQKLVWLPINVWYINGILKFTVVHFASYKHNIELCLEPYLSSGFIPFLNMPIFTFVL